MGVRNRIFTLSAAIGVGLIAIVATLIIWGIALSPASQGKGGEPSQNQPLHLEQAADQADRLSTQVYGGLETTKEIIGKTEGRNQAIEQGRDAASATLEQLADRARQAETAGDESLSVTDQRVLKHISE